MLRISGLRTECSILLIPVALWAALRFVFFEGLQGADDLEHLRFAWLLDRIPASHWEFRLPYNLLMAASLRVFGFSEFAAAVPGLIGSLLLLMFSMVIARRLSGSTTAALIAGVIVATLPGDVIESTNVSSSRGLAAGLLATALWAVLSADRNSRIVLAGVCFALAIDCHLSILFFVSIFFAGLAILQPELRKPILWAWLIGAALFTLIDPLLWYALTGDPLLRIHVMEATHFGQLATDGNTRDVFLESGASIVSSFCGRSANSFSRNRSVSCQPRPSSCLLRNAID